MNQDKKILIIDDDSRNIFALKAVLRKKGFHCLSAEDARSGLEILQTDTEIAIVLMDMMMPDMDGYEAIQLLQQHAEPGNIPVVAVTAQAMVGDQERCLAAGAADYVSKPIDVDHLLNVLEKHLKN